MANKASVFNLNPGQDKNRIPISTPNLEDDYSGFVKLLERGAEISDYVRFRMCFLESEQYFSPERDDARAVEEQMFRAQESNDLRQAAECAAKLLSANYTHLIAHFILTEYYDSMHLEQYAELHARIALGLLTSIVDNGDGSSPETAYIIYSEEEIMAVVAQLEGEIVNREFIKQGDEYFSVFNFEKDAEKYVIYFNITAVFPGEDELEEDEL